MRKSIPLLAISTIASMGISPSIRRSYDEIHGDPIDHTPKSPKYSFTDEEKEKLSSLGGKAKREYLKELKERHDG